MWDHITASSMYNRSYKESLELLGLMTVSQVILEMIKPYWNNKEIISTPYMDKLRTDITKKNITERV